MKRKNNLWVSLLVITGLALFIATACDKDEKDGKQDETPTPTTTNTLNANINGSSFVGGTILRQTAGNVIAISGRVGTQSMAVMILDTVKAGTYPLKDDYFNCRLQYNPTDNEYYMSTSGSVTLTEFSKTGKIKGTFDCIVTKVAEKGATISITNGKLEIN
jgi:hypothetical protein